MAAPSNALTPKSDPSDDADLTTSPAPQLPSIEDLVTRPSSSSTNEEPRLTEGVTRAGAAIHPLGSLAANDDYAAIDTQLRVLNRHGGQQAEILALAWTSLVTFMLGCLLKVFGGETWLPWPLLLTFSFLASAILFFAISTAIRQRLAQAALKTLLRTSAHLAEPEVSERHRLAVIPERFRADIATLDRSVAKTSERVGQVVETMNRELEHYERRFASVQKESEVFLENLSLERATIVTNGENLRHALSSVSTDISKDLNSVAGNLQTLFQSKSENLIEIIDQRNQQFIRDYLETEERAAVAFKKAMDQSLVKAVERYEANNERFLTAMARRQDDYDNKIDRQFRESFTKADNQIAVLCAKADEISADASKQVEDLLLRAEEATDKRSKSLQTMLAGTIIDLSQTFKANTVKLKTAIDESSSQMQHLTTLCEGVKVDLAKQIVEFETAVVQPLDHLTSAFGEKSRTVANNVLIEITSFNEAAAQAATQIGMNCEKEKRRLRDVSEEAVEEVRNCMDNLIRECATAVARCSEAIELSTERITPPRTTSRQANQPATRSSLQPRSTSERGEAERPQFRAYTVASPENLPTLTSGQSWISQLLARADAAGSAEQVMLDRPKSIDTIATVLNSIDSLIVTEECSAAWDTFREKNRADFEKVFTSEGRAALKVVKDKLDYDQDLYSFVETYLERFENLLQEAYAAADDTALVSYMSSSSGKVYTLLAYAVERI